MQSLSIHLTDQCNNSCKFCVVDSYQGAKEKVNLKVVYNYLKNNADKGYERVNLHGGEPTIIPEFFEVLQFINEFNYKYITLQTNARALSDMEFAKRVVDLGVNLFVVSVHGKDAEQHDFLTTAPGGYQEAIQGITNVIKLGAKVRTNTVVCKQNKDDLVEIVEKCMDLGCNHINISGMHPTGKAFKNYDLVTPKYTEVVNQIKNAVDAVSKRGVACTIEGIPLCLLDGYLDYLINWEEEQFKLLFRNTILENYDTFMKNVERKAGEKCKACSLLSKCGGVYKEYLKFNDWSEFNPVISKE